MLICLGILNLKEVFSSYPSWQKVNNKIESVLEEMHGNSVEGRPTGSFIETTCALYSHPAFIKRWFKNPYYANASKARNKASKPREPKEVGEDRGWYSVRIEGWGEGSG